MKRFKFFGVKTQSARCICAGALLVLALQAPKAFAWSAGGHMVVADIAYGELTPNAKAKVDALLLQHPDASKWMQDHTDTDPPMGEYLFMRASTWPDEIRRQGNPFDHPSWHFVDYPLTAPYQEVPDTIAGPTPEDDVLLGIASSEKSAGDETAPAATRAAYVSWIIHLVGDIHQPLHCSSFISNEFPAPQGDKGGNSFYVKVTDAGQPIRLHSFWDGLMGTSKNVRQADQNAIDLKTRMPRTMLTDTLTTRSTVRDWSLDACRMALTDAYLNGKLPIATSADQATALPDGYTARAKTDAEKQVSLAGYRLADELNRLYP